MIDNISLNIVGRCLETNEGVIALTRNECIILKVLLENKDTVVSKEILVKHIYNSYYLRDWRTKKGTLYAFCWRLRRKLPLNTIDTILHRGFILHTKGISWSVQNDVVRDREVFNYEE